MSLFSELKRRNVLRVAAAYIAVSWLLIQVVETLFPIFGLSDAAIRFIVIVLAVGFIPAVAIAWAFDLTPDGLVRDGEVDHDSAASRTGAKRLDRFVMVALALAVGFFTFDKFLLDPARDQEIADAAREQGRAEAVEESQSSNSPVLAVLPFAAVTDNEDSRFFAAGVHDDLLTKLAKLPSMLVISRTSVLEYQDVQRNIRQIGEELGATAILEGGVQSIGDRIRINAQLIDARTDKHLWAETYDRELTTASIFDVQDEIARAISEALHLTIGDDDQDNPIPTSNMAAYRAYHEAIIAGETVQGRLTSTEYRELLHKAVELDPAFTRPLALLVGSYGLEVFANRDQARIRDAEAVLEQLRSVAPDSIDYLIAQTYYAYYILRDYDLALQIATQALEMVPSETHLIAMSGWIKRRQGDFQGHNDAMQMARQLEPTDSSWTEGIVSNLVLMHQYDAALAEIEAFKGRLFELEYLRSMINVREHGDLLRHAEEATRLGDEIGEGSYLWDIWTARINAGDYQGALEVWNAIPPRTQPPGSGLSGKQATGIETWRGLGEAEKLAEAVADARATLDQPLPEGREAILRTHLEELLLAAVAGDIVNAERHARDWFRASDDDLAEKALYFELVCRYLGIAGATEAAVECIRNGLTQPSTITPFIEPHVSYYDAIRDEPAFVELLEELAAMSPN